MRKLQFFSDVPQKERYYWRKLVYDVLMMLPVDARNKILSECTVFCAYNKIGSMMELTGNKIIVLDCLQMDIVKLSRKERMLIVAHEFAHEILGHTSGSIEDEKEANALMEKWGFLSFDDFCKKLGKMEVSYVVFKGSKIGIPEMLCSHCKERDTPKMFCPHCGKSYGGKE